ncbi:MAG: ABC transporter permease [Candidatus Dojkabacteria bacterium]|nr:ABC transporter permease [Candidatus Dojkabacteria bacterium]MDQ7021198.1 ABC transporter permease [Candidatus Dojkabacteria bacterium]
MKQGILNKIYWQFSDIKIITWRNLLKYKRVPQLLVFSTIQPIIFVMLFTYVFGGEINIPGLDYIDYLLPGIMVQTVFFGATQTGISLAEDLSKGLISRFKTLPMSRAAVLTGRTISDIIRNTFVVLLVIGVGVLNGFSPTTNPVYFLSAIGLITSIGYAFTWIFATLGMLVKDQETAQVAGFVIVFPMVFASSAFARVESMPAPLRNFAEISPATTTIDAMRKMLIYEQFTDNITKTLIWVLVLLSIFIPLSVYRYTKS